MNFNYFSLSVLQQAILDFLSTSITGQPKTVKQVYEFITVNALVEETASITRRTIQRNLVYLEDKNLLKKERKGRTDFYTRVLNDEASARTRALVVKPCQNDEALNSDDLAKRFPNAAKSGYMEYQPWVVAIINQAKAAITKNRRLLFTLDVDCDSRNVSFNDIPVSKGYRQYDAVVIGTLSFSQVPHLLFRYKGKTLAARFNRIAHVEASSQSYSYVNHDTADFNELVSFTDCLKPVQRWARFEKVVSKKVVDLLIYRQLKGIRDWACSDQPEGVQLSFEYDENDPEMTLFIELITPLENTNKNQRRAFNCR